MPYPTRRRFLAATAAVGVTGLSGCTSGSRDGSGGPAPTDNTPARPGRPTRRTTGSAAGAASASSQGPPVADRSLPIMYEFERLQRNVQSGGPPKDGIPSIDEPVFIDADGGDQLLDPGDIVFGYAGADDIKAYPQSVIVWHEIVNDVLDGVPTSVTYCPLTGTVLGFRRGPTTFGVSGQLLNNNLIMYDRATDSRWPQVLGTAIAGQHQGQSLEETRLVWTTWRQWTSLHPETKVLSEQTGYARNYNRDPYGQYNPKAGYYDGGSTLFPPLTDDDRFPPKEVVMGARLPAGAMAFHKSSLAEAGVIDASLDGMTYTAVYDNRLDTAYVYANPDGTPVTVDGTTARLDGESHPPDALPFDRVHTFDAMWFAWSGFYPETAVHR